MLLEGIDKFDWRCHNGAPSRLSRTVQSSLRKWLIPLLVPKCRQPHKRCTVGMRSHCHTAETNPTDGSNIAFPTFGLPLQVFASNYEVTIGAFFKFSVLHASTALAMTAIELIVATKATYKAQSTLLTSPRGCSNQWQALLR